MTETERQRDYAAAPPLVLGAMSVTITGAPTHLLSRSMEMSVLVSDVASMTGIGVAVDLSLFVLARHGEDVRAGASRPPWSCSGAGTGASPPRSGACCRAGRSKSSRRRHAVAFRARGPAAATRTRRREQ